VNDVYPASEGRRRLIAWAFNLEDADGRSGFLQASAREVNVPGSGRIVRYDAEARTGIGVSRLGTSEAIAVGAYAFALDRLA